MQVIFKYFGIGFLIAFSLPVYANYEVQKIIDSYVVAKGEDVQTAVSEDELKKNPFTIQVASYINEKDAVSHVEELKVHEKDVMYFPSFVRGQIWFKVCVGKFAKKEEADAFRTTFIKHRDEPFAVVISLLDRPSPDQEFKAPKNSAKTEKRNPAALTEKEDVAVPTENSDSSDAPMEVKLRPKYPSHLAMNEPETSETAKPDQSAAAKSGSASALKPAASVKPVAAVKKVETSTEDTDMPPEAASPYYTLQVGAFPTEALAKQKIGNISVKDVEMFYKTAVVNGKQWYRVFLGRFKSKQEAESFQKTFSEEVRGAESFIRHITE